MIGKCCDTVVSKITFTIHTSIYDRTGNHLPNISNLLPNPEKGVENYHYFDHKDTVNHSISHMHLDNPVFIKSCHKTNNLISLTQIGPGCNQLFWWLIKDNKDVFAYQDGSIKKYETAIVWDLPQRTGLSGLKDGHGIQITARRSKATEPCPQNLHSKLNDPEP
ncbi:hypothetical protein ACJX0J_030125 [Zea mays]